MIYTVTFNPSLDYIVTVEHFAVGRVNRTCHEMMLPGGKGINVSRVLGNLGLESRVLGFVAGFTGREIKRRVQEDYCLQESMIELESGMSRINVKLRSDEESEINGMGPDITRDKLEEFYVQLDALTDQDTLVLAGSIPASLPADMYSSIMERLHGKNVRIVVDATGKLLVNVLKYHPFLVKPNNFELGEIFGVHDLRDKAEVAVYAKKLQEMGAMNVLVSMAGDGAVLVTEQGDVLTASAPEGTVVNSVGAGDSMVAGFLYGYVAKGSYEEAFAYGLCAGSASAFSENLATKEEIERLLARQE